MSDSEPETSHPFFALRGHSVNAYSKLEHSLCVIFRYLLGTSEIKAAIVFFKIHNSRARNMIIGNLLNENYGKRYNSFWNSYFKLLQPLDDKRNSIVHWVSRAGPGDGNLGYIPVLMPPNVWNETPDTPSLDEQDMRDFIEKCRFFAAITDKFTEYVCRGNPSPLNAAWQDIFRKALVYPLPADHLLYKQPQISRIPP